jgi:hypothetical protein
MTKSAILALSFACLIGGTAAAAPASPTDAADFTALEANWLHAIAARDTAKLNRILAPEFVDTTWNGLTRNKGEALEHAKDYGAMGQQKLSDITVRRFGNVAVVTGLNSVVVEGGPQYDVRFTDVFVLRDKRWQAVNAQETPVVQAKIQASPASQ